MFFWFQNPPESATSESDRPDVEYSYEISNEVKETSPTSSTHHGADKFVKDHMRTSLANVKGITDSAKKELIEETKYYRRYITTVLLKKLDDSM